MGIDRLILQYSIVLLWLISSFVLHGQDQSRFKDLPSIHIHDRKRNFIERNDTIMYEAKPFMKKEIHKVKDLLSYMPGFTVDPSGRIMFNGKEIKHVLINGNDLSGNKYEVITKNMQAGLISKVELVKRFHENRLLTDIEWGEEQAVNLVIDNQKQYKVNLQHTFGATPALKRKECEGNIISIYKKSSSLIFYDMNNSGRIPNGLDPISGVSSNDPENFKLPNGQRPIPVSSDIPERYLRSNGDKGVILNHSYKWNQHLVWKIRAAALSSILQQKQTNIISYDLPGTQKWDSDNRSIYNFNGKVLEGGIGVYYDDLKKHVSSYEINVGRNVLTASNQLYSTSPIIDTGYQAGLGCTKLISISGNESFQINKKYVLVWGNTLISSLQNNEMDLMSLKLQFLPEHLNGSLKLQEYSSAKVDLLQSDIKLLFKTKQHYFQVGLKFFHQGIGSSNTIHSIKFQNVYYHTLSDAIYHLNKLNLFIKNDHTINKRLFISWQSAIGISNISWDYKRKSSITGSVSTSLNFHQNNFRQTYLVLALSKNPPNKNLYHVSPLLNEQFQFMYGAPFISFPIKGGFKFVKTYSDFYKGISITSSVSLDKDMNNTVSSIYQYPFYSIHRYQLSRANGNFSFNGKVQKNIFHLMIKPFIEFRHIQMKQDVYLNGDYFKSHSMLSECQMGMVSYWKTLMNIETSLQLNSSRIELKPWNQRESIMNVQNKADLKIKYDISGKTYCSIYGMILWYKKYSNSSTFMDAYLEHRFSDRATFMIRLHNLFNQLKYVERRNSTYMTQESSIELIPRYFMFSVQFNL